MMMMMMTMIKMIMMMSVYRPGKNFPVFHSREVTTGCSVCNDVRVWIEMKGIQWQPTSFHPPLLHGSFLLNDDE